MAIQKITTDILKDNSVTGSKMSIGTPEAGDIVYYDGTDYVKLAKGTDGEVLKLESGLPVWGQGSGGSGGGVPSHLGGTLFLIGSSALPNPTAIHFLNMATLGDTQSFGNVTATNDHVPNGPTGNNDRVLVAGGNDNQGNWGSNIIQHFNPNTQGNTSDFGDLSRFITSPGACNDATRAVWGGGEQGPVTTNNYNPSDKMEYVTIATNGNAQDLGDLNIIGSNTTGGGGSRTAQTNQMRSSDGCSDGTHGYWISGYGGFTNSNHFNNPPGASFLHVIQKFTIQTSANCTQFGTAGTPRTAHFAETDGTRIIYGGGTNVVNAPRSEIDFITNATGGASSTFGAFLTARRNIGSGCNGTRAVISGNTECGNTIEYITTATLGDAQDFGDMVGTNNPALGCAGGNG